MDAVFPTAVLNQIREFNALLEIPVIRWKSNRLELSTLCLGYEGSRVVDGQWTRPRFPLKVCWPEDVDVDTGGYVTNPEDGFVTNPEDGFVTDPEDGSRVVVRSFRLACGERYSIVFLPEVGRLIVRSRTHQTVLDVSRQSTTASAIIVVSSFFVLFLLLVFRLDGYLSTTSFFVLLMCTIAISFGSASCRSPVRNLSTFVVPRETCDAMNRLPIVFVRPGFLYQCWLCREGNQVWTLDKGRFLNGCPSPVDVLLGRTDLCIDPSGRLYVQGDVVSGMHVLQPSSLSTFLLSPCKSSFSPWPSPTPLPGGHLSVYICRLRTLWGGVVVARVRNNNSLALWIADADGNLCTRTDLDLGNPQWVKLVSSKGNDRRVLVVCMEWNRYRILEVLVGDRVGTGGFCCQTALLLDVHDSSRNLKVAMHEVEAHRVMAVETWMNCSRIVHYHRGTQVQDLTLEHEYLNTST
jgi:hypothetical protein